MSDPPPAPRVGVMRLLEAHGLRQDTDLGQHFLLDENLVDVALREGKVGPEDVALEVGAGVGVLTAGLARTARFVHAVEVDRRMAPALADVLAGAVNVRLHWGDAMRMDLAALDPPPTCFVANLPYAVATPLVVDSLHTLPGVERWAVMVQREVADRWAAPAGSRLYGAPSVLLGSATEQTFRRSVGREVFAPRPRVDSALVAMRRTGPAPSPEMRALVRAAFGQRRKTLANALASAGADRARVAAALVALGRPATARPESLTPADYRRLAEEDLGWTA